MLIFVGPQGDDVAVSADHVVMVRPWTSGGVDLDLSIGSSIGVKGATVAEVVAQIVVARRTGSAVRVGPDPER